MKKAEPAEVIPSKKIIVGDEKAPITLMMFGDYESDATARANVVIKHLLENFPEDVKFIFRHFPLTTIHQKAHKAAEAALAAGQEGKFWEMHNELFERRHSLGTISLKSHARSVGVKSKTFLDDLISSLYGMHIQDDLKEGIDKGVKEIPALFINGKLYKNEISIENLELYIKELASKSKQVKKAA
jgi:protein-disulfide isomerase